jgi:DNA polymerase I-like protein with 3'-5' exonuclease and polymerase domains
MGKPVAVVDFETHPIESRPHYPPKPVGVSIMLPGERKAKYWSFGHPTENNCSERDAKRALEVVWKDPKIELLFHHGKFDTDVAETFWGLALPDWRRFHDTLYLAFLFAPHSRNLDLKGLAEELLGMPPEERNAIRDWCIAQKLIPKNAKEIGHLIWKAPGALVGTYANGDVIRTRKLFDKIYPEIVAAGMQAPYDRERRLMPILLRNEREGIEANERRIITDEKFYSQASATAEAWVRKRLKAPNLQLDSNDDLADALVRADAADEGLFLQTAKGKRSVAKDSLIGAVTDKRVLQVLQYKSRLDTCLRTFIRPWAKEAQISGGRVFPSWNQVRSDEAGARTGRMSASRFMNVPKQFEEEEGKFEMPRFHGLDLPELPQVRLYLRPDKGQVWGKRDYSQQELRMLGHFENGNLMEKYAAEPAMDIHQLAADMVLAQYGFPYDRKFMRKVMKTLGFGLIYGMGVGALAVKLGLDVKTATDMRNAYLAIFPGLKTIQTDLKIIAANDEAFRTWGGRLYKCEPATWSERFNRLQTYEYKMLNYLIQGSSADCTKEAIIRYDEVRKDGRFLVTVHDEINFSAAAKAMKSEMRILREAMASIEVDVIMLSDGATGPSWGELKEFSEEGWWKPLVQARNFALAA